MKKYVTILALIPTVSMLSPSVTHAAGNQTFINSASGIGNAFAASAAVVDDASVQFVNPAGLTFLNKHQLVVGGGAAVGNRSFNGTTTFTPFFPVTISQTGKASANIVVGQPLIYYNVPIAHNRVAFGIGFTAYGGSGQGFPDQSILRYTSTKSLIAIVNMGPNLSVKVTDQVSAGLGIDMSYLYSQLNARSFTGTPVDAKLFNYAGNFGYGLKGGLMYSPRPSTKIGLAYHTQITYRPTGTSTYVIPGFPVKTEFSTSNLHYRTLAAPSTSLSVYQRVNPILAVMGGLDFTQWNRIHSVTLYNIASPFGPITATNMLNYRNTWRISGAVNYYASDYWMLRIGAYYDQDPTDHQYGSADAVPNTNQIFLGLGARYTLNRCASFDFGYGHYFAQSINIGYNTPVFTQNGTYHVRGGNLIGAQANFNFV